MELRRKPSATGPGTVGAAPLHGQRQRGRAVRCALAGVALVAAVGGSQAEGDGASDWPLPAAARHLSLDVSLDRFCLSHALGGVTFLDEEAPGSVHTRTDWPTLASVSLGEGRFLLAGRFSDLKLVTTWGSGESLTSELVESWVVEGIPTDLVLEGGRLIVAAGGVGVQIFRWDEEEGRLGVLAARYPFVDYSKELALSGDEVLYIADNLDTGLQVLDCSLLERPRFLAARRLGFVDSVSEAGGLVAVADRKVGFRLFSMKDPTNPVEKIFVPLQASTTEKVNSAARVRLDNEGRLLICESAAPARLLRLVEDDRGEAVSSVDITPPAMAKELVLEGRFLGDGRLAVCTENARLLLIPLDPIPPRETVEND